MSSILLSKIAMKEFSVQLKVLSKFHWVYLLFEDRMWL
ncbi:unnamed protein product [Schistosoma curassoni]|uniref:Uncharacterized protein n=1 Tax=Schistosoma curassoni TaxID=6186 RepID=A0A183KGX4_9TREM|nr:unnamed protein product [Schistosoma curassoni]